MLQIGIAREFQAQIVGNSRDDLLIGVQVEFAIQHVGIQSTNKRLGKSALNVIHFGQNVVQLIMDCDG